MFSLGGSERSMNSAQAHFSHNKEGTWMDFSKGTFALYGLIGLNS